MKSILESYRENLESKGNSELTIKNELSAVNGFVKWYIEWNQLDEDTILEEFIEDVTPVVIRDWKDFRMDKLSKPHMKTKAAATEATLNKTLQRLKRFFEFIKKSGFSYDNPAEKHSAVTVAQLAPKSLTADQQEELKRRIKKMYMGSHLAKKNYRNYTLIMVLLHTGLRVSELAGLKSGNLIESKKGKEVKYAFDFYGKGGQRRQVTLNREIRDIFLDYQKNHTVSGEYLFDSERSDQITARAIQHIVTEINKELSFNFTAHQLRHTFIKNLLVEGVKRGMNPEMIGRVAGHFHKDGTVNLSQTMRYAMSTPEEASDITEILSAY